MKKILQIVFFIVLIFGGFKVLVYMGKIPKFEERVNSEIFKYNNKTNLIKPKIKDANQKITNTLSTVKKIENNFPKKVMKETKQNVKNFVPKTKNMFPY